jgi:hypothetical protein
MGYNNRKNYLTGNALSDEWYTPKFIVDKCIDIVKNKLGGGTTLLPFDTNKSVFVKELKNINCDMCYGITDFLSDNKYDCSLIMTNPPFSLKEKVFEKCLEYNKDFILVLPETFIFSVGFYDLLEKYNFHYKLYSPKQRVYFIDENGNQNRPNFHTIIIYVSKNFTENSIEHFYSKTK